MMQADNFILKLLALIYVGNKKGKCKGSVLWFEEFFSPLFYTLKILEFFFFLNQYTFIWKLSLR